MNFTIAIPTYNNEKTIDAAILSCLNQATGLDYEVLISDDGSQDRTWEIIQGYKKEHSNISVIQNKLDSNVWLNHNRCMENAEGDYILFCHAGDQLLPHALETIHNKLKERNYPAKYVVWGHCMYKDFQIRRLILFDINLEERIIGEKAYKLFVDGGLTPSGTCYSRKTFLKYGGFVEDRKMIFPHSDSMTMLKLAFNGFGFEMINDMYFDREKTSTLHLYEKPKEQQNETANYMKQLLTKNFDEYELTKIGVESTGRNFVYAYYISRINKHLNKLIKRKTISKLLRNPLLLRKGNIRKIFMS